MNIRHLIIASVSMLTMLSPVKAEEFEAVTIANKRGDITMTVTNFGARIQSLNVDGTDVVLGFDTLSHYKEKKQNFGAVVGRYIGRIVGGSFTLDGKEYKLNTGKKAGADCSHGGTPGFSQLFWKIVKQGKSFVTLRFVSPDGDNGFPGELTLDVTYSLTKDALRIDYQATTTKPTVLNPSNHSFFNLSGNLGGDVLAEELWINSDSIALYNQKKQVTGEMACVTDTPFDFSSPTAIGERIDTDNEQLMVTKGYDHCYKLCTGGCLNVPAARLTDRTTGLTMEVMTTEPAMQIYTANGHNGSLIGKGGTPYPRRNAICFETMHFPDSPNKPQWPTTTLRPGEKFRSTTIFKFSKDLRTNEALPSDAK